VRELAKRLAKAEVISVLTGAGVSAESGVPTFRGEDGFWKGRRAEDLATPQAFASNPETVWTFYDWRRSLLAKCRPNTGHSALAELEGLVPRMHLITQNVDGLHQAAGSRCVTEMHGSIWRVRCQSGCGEHEDRRTPFPPPLPPRCACGALLRPAVVWFGERLPLEALEAADEAARSADVFIVAGTSAVVEPAASFARLARSTGAYLVEINPEATPLSSLADDVIREPSARAIPQIVDLRKQSWADSQ